MLTDADDHVRPQRQLEQLVSGAGAADSVHGAEAGWAESLLPSDLEASVPAPPPAQHPDQVKPLTTKDTQSHRLGNSLVWCPVGDKAEELLVFSSQPGPSESSAAESKHRRPLWRTRIHPEKSQRLSTVKGITLWITVGFRAKLMVQADQNLKNFTAIKGSVIVSFLWNKMY